jgi:hypothetical protein
VLPRGRAHARAATKILLLGDSMIAGGFGLYLQGALREEGYEVERAGKSSTGLARPDFYDWKKEARRHVETFAPNASIVMFGGNDVQGLYMGKRKWIRWHEEGWAGEYGRRISALCDILAPAGERVFWVGMPVMRPPKFHARVQRINTIARAQMRGRPGGMFIDTWRVLANEDGAYADRIYVEHGTNEDGSPGRKKVRVRASDGIHLTPAGAHLLKAHVREIVVAELARDA